MQRILDKLILFLYCCIHVFIIPMNTVFIISFFCMLSLACLIFFLGSRKSSFVLLALYCCFIFPFPELCIFLPLILYDILMYRCYALCLPLFIGTFLYLPNASTFSLFLILLGCLFACWLKRTATHYESLSYMYKKTRDDSTELNLLLKEKNKNLLEKQDYEIYTATLKERNRIAREIHDNVGHMLSRSILMTGALKAINKDAALKEPLNQINDTLNLAMNNIRESVHDLHDESMNFKEAIHALVRDFQFCPVDLIYDIGLDTRREMNYSFIAIIKEALSNTMKHSNATLIRIVLREHPGLYQLVIEDNGTNIRMPKTTCGIGLINMKERIDMLKGVFQYQTEEGFRIFITIPKIEK